MSKVNIRTKETRFPAAPDLYGLFFEDISRAGDGGLYPEMLRNRSFEDSLLPEGCTTTDGGRTFVSPTGWIDEFNNGEGMNQWVKDNRVIPTPVPAWYSDGAEMSLDPENVLNPKRKVSLRVDFSAGGRIRNIGFGGIPQEQGKTYRFYLFARTDRETALTVSIEKAGRVSAAAEIVIRAGGWVRCDAELTAADTVGDAEFCIRCAEEATVRFGFMSLMPAETFMGHGLRKDLAEKLRDIHPAFLRFPGGCIVEGFSMETVWYFRNTVGPVWERPSHWLLWHYRTTNGLGFHEYLQLCEDLDVAPLYVCNCGMTCQGRNPRYFNEEEQADMLGDILDALEYALGPADSRWGALRARMGHEAPFRLDYLEIGNENWGPEYEWRFDRVKQAVSEFKPMDGLFRDNVILRTPYYRGPLSRNRYPWQDKGVVHSTLTREPLTVWAEKTEGWVAVKTDGTTCYVSADYVDVSLKTGKAITLEEEQAAIQAQKQKQAQETAKNTTSSGSGQTRSSGSQTGASLAASADEETLLAALVQCEAGGCGVECMTAVGAVVINRVRSGSYPNSIYNVIYQRGQFGPASSGRLESRLASGVSASARQAASAALAGSDPTGGAKSFKLASSGHAGVVIGPIVFY